LARRRRFPFAFLVVLAMVAGAGVAIWRGTGPLPDPEGCYATVGSGPEVGLEPDQGRNAALIAAIGVRRGLPARAVSIALATAYQESKIRNISYGDRDSIGIFQQRPSQGWGTVKQIRNEHYAIHKFYEALEKIDGYQDMRITEAAQRVQRSGFPEAYEDHAADARSLASALTGYSPDGAFTCVVHEPEGYGSADAVEESLTKAFGPTTTERTGARQDFTVPVGSGVEANRRGWAIAQYLVAFAGELKIAAVSFDGFAWKTGRASENGWTKSGSSDERVTVSLG